MKIKSGVFLAEPTQFKLAMCSPQYLYLLHITCPNKRHIPKDVVTCNPTCLYAHKLDWAVRNRNWLFHAQLDQCIDLVC